MTERDFCYWLQGFFELSIPESISSEQTAEIRKHLYTVFEHKCEKLVLNPDKKSFSERVKEVLLCDLKEYESTSCHGIADSHREAGLGPEFKEFFEVPVKKNYKGETLLCDVKPYYNEDAEGLKPAVDVNGMPKIFWPGSPGVSC